MFLAAESREVRAVYPWEQRAPHWLRDAGVTVEERLFLQQLERELERIDSFVVGQASELRNTLGAIERDTQRRGGFDADEIEREVETASKTLVELDSFILVNYNALRRIIGLHDAVTGIKLASWFNTRLATSRLCQQRFDGEAPSATCL